MTTPGIPPLRFTVACCRAPRLVTPTGVLICLSCDAGLTIPNAADLTDVPPALKRWPPA